jgi:transcriptional regulator with XRE-family HTH domain
VTELHRNLVRNLKRLRADLSLSQMDLAEKADISPGYVGEIEMGRKFPTPEVLERLADSLGVRPFRLLMGEEDAAEWLGGEAFYAAADEIRDRINRELDAMMRSRDANRDGGTPPGRGT